MRQQKATAAAGGARRRPAAQGMTLVELLVALSIFTVISTAVLTMVQAGAQVNSQLSATMTNQWEMESSLRRMVQQLRNCTAFNVPTTTAGGTSFTLTTEPDSANKCYAVSYTLGTAPNGARTLQETDTRYGTSVLVHNVQSFDVRTSSARGIQEIILTIAAGAPQPVSRRICVTPRNQ